MKKLFLSLLCIAMSLACTAQSYQPTKENLEARRQFQDAKFGIFIHWGVYSMLGNGEWVMHNRKINYQEYAKLPASFYPVNFNAEEWIKAFKDAGARYITFTTRHHDGFSMFKTATSNYNIVDGTPFHRDVVGELAKACQKEGLSLHLYYSHLDWHRLDYPLGRTGLQLGRPTDQQNWKSYFNFMNQQLTELLTNYGKVGAIWFDGMWDHDKDKTPFDWQLTEQYRIIHKLQPACLVINNHHLKPFDGEDAQTFEKDFPGHNTTGFADNQEIGELPLEECQTMNDDWGYNITDLNYKSLKELIHLLVTDAGYDANLLLNVGPQPDGQIPATALERLKGMGEWLRQYGETIYGTRGGYVAPQKWGATTLKGNKLYVHILKLDTNELQLPVLPRKVLNAKVYGEATKVGFKKNKNGVLLQLPKTPTETDYIVELTLQNKKK